jgi:hypothetical protein
LGVVGFAVAMLVVPPAILVGVLAIVRLISRRLARAVHVLLVGVLVGLVASPFVNSLGLPSVVDVMLCGVIAAAAALAYVKVPAVGRYATVLAVAPVALAVLFLASGPVRALLGQSRSAPEAHATADGRTPIVMLVMDEFSQGSLLTPDGTIDADRFPHFAELADRSTWYPNATTNSNATRTALPALLTGRFPRNGIAPPVLSAYPQNLFTLLGSSYDFSVDEWVTSMCPVDRCRERPVAYRSVKHLAADTVLVYLHIVLPNRLKAFLPPMGHRWAGFFANPADTDQRLTGLPRSLRPIGRAMFGWLDEDRFRSVELDRFGSFVSSIGRRERPTLNFLHVGLPHQPWHLLPSARPYDRQDTPGLDRSNLVWADPVSSIAGFQRYEMQVKATDHLIGELIDRLDQKDVWDDALVIALADHGVTFRPGKTTRAVVGTEGDLLPIPLFVKFPHQRSGRVDRRNVELIDVLPTIADVAGIDAPWRMDGTSLAKDDPQRPEKRVWVFGRALPPYDLDIADRRTEMARTIRDVFGKASTSDDLFGFGPHRKLVGRRVEDLDVGRPNTRSRIELENAGRFARYDADASYVPARPSGRIHGGERFPWIAVAVNGTVAGIGQPHPEGGTWAFEIVVSDAYLRPGRNRLAFLGIDDDGHITAIRAP